MKFYYFLRNYKFDLLTAIFAILSYLISYKFAPDQKIILLLLLLITLISVSCIIYLRLREKDFYFIELTGRKDKDDWIGRGNFEYRRTSDAYLISNSESGYIYSKTLGWSDYQFDFKFKILNECIGAIVRAANLSDYVMFQIRDYGIRPHIRINGGWRPWEAKETNLEFENKLSSDKWYNCSITCEKDLVTIIITNENEEIFHRSWTISHERLGFPFPQKENDQHPPVIHFPINLDYGTIGFRNTGPERALVKNVLIEKL